MFTVSYKEITSPHFNHAFQELSTKSLPIKVAYNIKRMADKLHIVRKQLALEYQKDIVETFAKKDADGKIVHPKDAEGNFMEDQFDLDETKKPEMEAAVKAFGDRTVTIDRHKLVIESITCELSASHLAALEPIFESLEEMHHASQGEEAAS